MDAVEDDEDLIVESAEQSRAQASKIQLRCSAITTSILIFYFHHIHRLLLHRRPQNIDQSPLYGQQQLSLLPHGPQRRRHID